MKSRIKTLLVPYLFWNTLVFCFFFSIGNASLGELFEYVLLAKNSPTYFIGIILLFVALSPVIRIILENKISSICLVVVSLCIPFLKLQIADYGYMNFINSSHINLVYYVSGAYAGRYYAESVKKRVPMSFGITAAFGAVLMMCMYYYAPNLRPLWRTISIICIWRGLDIFRFERKPIEVTKYTFVYYCSHIIVVACWYKLFELLVGPTTYFPLLTMILVPILTVISVYCGCRVMNKIFPTILRMVSGGRG